MADERTANAGSFAERNNPENDNKRQAFVIIKAA